MEPTEDYSEYYNGWFEGPCVQAQNQSLGLVLGPYVHSVICVLGLIGNSLMLLTLCCSPRPASVTQTLLLHLALADLVIVLILPGLVVMDLGAWPDGGTGCKLLKGGYSLSLFSAALLLTAVSVDRYAAVVHARTRLRAPSVNLKRAVSAVVWLTAAALSLPNFICYDLYVPQHSSIMTHRPQDLSTSMDWTQFSVFEGSISNRTLPDSALNLMLPDSALNLTLPDSALNLMLPDSALNLTLPDSALNLTLPDSALNLTLPDSALNLTLPDSALNLTLPDSALNLTRHDSASSLSPADPDPTSRPVCELRFQHSDTARHVKLLLPSLQITVGFLIPLLLMSFCYGSILHTLLRGRVLCSGGRGTVKGMRGSGQGGRDIRRERAVRVVLMVALVFVLCHAPYNLILLWATIIKFKQMDCQSSDSLESALSVSQTLALLHCVLNPLLYGFNSAPFRTAFGGLLHKLRPQRRLSSTSQSERSTLYTL